MSGQLEKLSIQPIPIEPKIDEPPNHQAFLFHHLPFRPHLSSYRHNLHSRSYSDHTHPYPTTTTPSIITRHRRTVSTNTFDLFSLITGPPPTHPFLSCLLPPHRPQTHRPVQRPPKKTKERRKRRVKDRVIRKRRNHPRRRPCPERDDPRPASDTTAPTAPRPSLDLPPYGSIPILTRAKDRLNVQRRAVTVNSVFRAT